MKLNTAVLLCAFTFCIAFSSATYSAEGIMGRKLMQTPRPTPAPNAQYGYTTNEIFNYTISAANSSTSYQNHANGIDTSNNQCIIFGAVPSMPGFSVVGPLTFKVPSNKIFVNALNKYYPEVRYQLYNVTGATDVTSVTSDGTAPTSFRFAPTAVAQNSTIQIGLFAGSDATARCLLSVTYVATEPNYSPAPSVSG